MIISFVIYYLIPVGLLTILNFLVFISFRRHVKFVNSSSNLGGPNPGQEYMIKIKVLLTIVTVFLVCHLPRIFTDIQEIVCGYGIQVSLDEGKILKVSLCGNIITN